MAKKEEQLNEKRIPPTHKPIRLYRWLISEFAQKGWKLLDTNGGGMSIAIAADELNHDLDICEIDKDYFNGGSKDTKLSNGRCGSFSVAAQKPEAIQNTLSQSRCNT